MEVWRGAMLALALSFQNPQPPRNRLSNNSEGRVCLEASGSFYAGNLNPEMTPNDEIASFQASKPENLAGSFPTRGHSGEF